MQVETMGGTVYQAALGGVTINGANIEEVKGLVDQTLDQNVSVQEQPQGGWFASLRARIGQYWLPIAGLAVLGGGYWYYRKTKKGE